MTLKACILASLLFAVPALSLAGSAGPEFIGKADGHANILALEGYNPTASERIALANFTSALEAAGVWDKIHQLSPILGGTDATHSISMIGPNLTMTGGGISHTAAGIVSPGSPNYVRANISLSSALSSRHLAVASYWSGDTVNASEGARWGANNPSSQRPYILQDTSSGVDLTSGAFLPGYGIAWSTTGSVKCLVAGTDSDTSAFIVEGGIVRAYATVSTEPLPYILFILMARNSGANYSPKNYRAGTLSTHILGEGWTVDEGVAVSIAVDAYNAALGR